MVKSFLKYSNSSIFVAALLLVILIYSKAIKPVQRHPFVSLCAQKDVFVLNGMIGSSPKKISNGKYYSAYFHISETESEALHSTGSGTVTVFIPTVMVEAIYPGKLYTLLKSKNACLWETGGRCTVYGRFSGDNFYISDCTRYYFPKTVRGTISKFRALCRLQFKRLLYGWGKAGGLLLALLAGSREYTEEVLGENFRKAGLSHILALSGMHLSLFSGIAIFAGTKLKRKKLTVIIRILTVIGFVWFAGFSPSLLRAFICNLLLILAILAGTVNPDMLQILAFSFIIQTIIAPGDLFNSGFILSYTALAGILIFNRLFVRLFNYFLPSYVSLGFASSTGAQIFTAPVSLKLFGSFSPFGIVATFVVSPIVTLFIYSGLILFILSLIIPSLAVPSGIFMNFQYNFIKLLVSFFAKLPVININ